MMDTAFINRVGISRFVGYFGSHIYFSKHKGLSWIRRVTPFFEYILMDDLENGMNDIHYGAGLDIFIIKRGFFRVLYRNEKEVWLLKRYNKKNLLLYSGIQPFRWLVLNGSFRIGDQIYYHHQNPFLGKGRAFTLNVNIQPSYKININFGYIYDLLKQQNIDNPQTVYSVNIYNLLSSYQFNKHFFLRGAARYNDFNKKLVFDFLASYTLVPGTVAHIGYGLLYDDKKWEKGEWIPGSGLINMKRNLFVKISYLWRL